MTTATHASRSRLADIDGVLPHSPHQRLARQHRCGTCRAHPTTNAPCKSLPYPGLAKQTAASSRRAGPQDLKQPASHLSQ
jgi:hypothetical protein